MTTEATEKRALADEDKQAIAALAATAEQIEAFDEAISLVDDPLEAAGDAELHLQDAEKLTGDVQDCSPVHVGLALQRFAPKVWQVVVEWWKATRIPCLATDKELEQAEADLLLRLKKRRSRR